MRYVVLYEDDDGRRQVKDKIYPSLLDAEIYCDSISISRNPVVIPYIPMNPTSSENGEFTPRELGDMVSLLRDIGDIFLFSYDEQDAGTLTSSHYLQALNHIDNAKQSLTIAKELYKRGVGYGQL